MVTEQPLIVYQKKLIKANIGRGGKYTHYTLVPYDNEGRDLSKKHSPNDIPHLQLTQIENTETGSSLQPIYNQDWQDRIHKSKLHIVVPSTGRLVDMIISTYGPGNEGRAKRLRLDYKPDNQPIFLSDWAKKYGREAWVISAPAPWEGMSNVEISDTLDELVALIEAQSLRGPSSAVPYNEDLVIIPTQLDSKQHRVYTKPAGALQYDITR